MTEFPVPLAQLGPARLPFLGGIYLRYLPTWLIRRWARAHTSPVLWTYLHPYDFDAAETYTRMPGTAAWVSVLLWLNRGGTWKKLGHLLESGAGKPLGEMAADAAFSGALPTVNAESLSA